MIQKKYMLFIFFFLPNADYAQQFLQDSTLNNLVHPAGYLTCKLGELGGVKKAGTGKQTMILIPGLGFGGKVFSTFMDRHKDKYTMYEVTPAGFDGTPAPPMPDTSIKYSALKWTNGIVTGVLSLIEREKLNRPVIVAHFVTGTQVALNLALNYPDKIGRVIIIGGSPYRFYPSQKKDGTWSDWDNEKKYTPEQRGKLVETFWAPKWFKTVTKRTWDSNMWTPGDYCLDSTAGKELFNASAAVPLQVMIRYLIEWMAYDVTGKYNALKVPTLVLMPDFNGILLSTDSKVYLKYFHQQPWIEAKKASGSPMLTLVTIPNTRLFTWYDNPGATDQAIIDFLGR